MPTASFRLLSFSVCSRTDPMVQTSVVPATRNRLCTNNHLRWPHQHRGWFGQVHKLASVMPAPNSNILGCKSCKLDQLRNTQQGIRALKSRCLKGNLLVENKSYLRLHGTNTFCRSPALRGSREHRICTCCLHPTHHARCLRSSFLGHAGGPCKMST